MHVSYSPWGKPQHQQLIAEGIVTLSTAGHGGYHLSDERMAQFQQLFPEFDTWAGGPWFEEDEDWAAVAVAFPEHFAPRSLYYAVRTVRHAASRDEPDNRWVAMLAYIQGDAPKSVLLRALVKEFSSTTPQLWEVTSSLCGPGTPRDTCLYTFRRMGDGASRTEYLLTHPYQAFYTDGDIEQFINTSIVRPAQIEANPQSRSAA